MAMTSYRDPLLASPFRVMDELLRSLNTGQTVGLIDSGCGSTRSAAGSPTMRSPTPLSFDWSTGMAVLTG
jgi:hypothetical protein